MLRACVGEYPRSSRRCGAVAALDALDARPPRQLACGGGPARRDGGGVGRPRGSLPVRRGGRRHDPPRLCLPSWGCSECYGSSALSMIHLEKSGEGGDDSQNPVGIGLIRRRFLPDVGPVGLPQIILHANCGRAALPGTTSDAGTSLWADAADTGGARPPERLSRDLYRPARTRDAESLAQHALPLGADPAHSPSEFLLRSEGGVDERPERPPQNRPREAE